MSDKLKITFLGTGTSQGVPVIACRCKVCLSDDLKDKRLRSSVKVELGGKTVVIDSGPDFRQQMLRSNTQQLDAIVYTHEHKDHTAGLDDVRAFNFKQKRPMELFLSESVELCLKREYEYAFAENPYPGVPVLNLNRIGNHPFTVLGIQFNPVQLMHYKMPVFGFRIKDFAYCTDVNYISPKEKEKLFGLKVLVITALRKEKHISHFNLEEALSLIEELKPEKAYLTHISHLLGLHQDVSSLLPANVEIAYDGLEIEL